MPASCWRKAGRERSRNRSRSFRGRLLPTESEKALLAVLLERGYLLPVLPGYSRDGPAPVPRTVVARSSRRAAAAHAGGEAACGVAGGREPGSRERNRVSVRLGGPDERDGESCRRASSLETSQRTAAPRQGGSARRRSAEWPPSAGVVPGRSRSTRSREHPEGALARRPADRAYRLRGGAPRRATSGQGLRVVGTVSARGSAVAGGLGRVGGVAPGHHSRGRAQPPWNC